MKKTLDECRAIFKSYEDENGWINETTQQIAEDFEDDRVERISLLESLYTCLHFYETDFKDEIQSIWRFTE